MDSLFTLMKYMLRPLFYKETEMFFSLKNDLQADFWHANKTSLTLLN